MSAKRSKKKVASPVDGDLAITLIIRSRLDQMRMVRAALSGVLGHMEVVERDIHLLGLAVAEIINNRLEHAYKGDEDKQIEVRLRVNQPEANADTAEVRIDIVDDAPEFPPEVRYRLDEADPLEDPSDEWSMRGHGLQIVHEIVKSITFDAQNGYNCITIRKSVGVQRV